MSQNRNGMEVVGAGQSGDHKGWIHSGQGQIKVKTNAGKSGSMEAIMDEKE